jgi:hypothetical protein
VDKSPKGGNARGHNRHTKKIHGYYVLRLVNCDGVPKYSGGGLHDGVDETSFRGAVLNDWRDALGKDLLDGAWNSKSPEAAVGQDGRAGRNCRSARYRASRRARVCLLG